MDLNGKDEGRTLVSLEASVNQESAPLNSETLCELCNSIDFQLVDFYAEGFVFASPWNTWSSNVSEVLYNSEACFFCKMIRDFAIEKFNIQYPPGFERDVSMIEVTYMIGDFFAEDGPRSDRPDHEIAMYGLNHLVRLKVVLGASFGHDCEVLHFQRCSQHPPKVEDFCNGGPPSNWGIRPEQAYSGRIRPLLADTRLFRKWKETCCDVHGDRCNSIFTHGRWLPRLRLIDVVKRCVVDHEKGDVVGGEAGIRYTALSYVWGKDKFSQLTKSTEAQFRQAGSLEREVIPSTIDDAIEVTKSLGEKYIWVDSLCIIQDDEADKQEFIPKMDSIYGFALVTIVAASGDNANAGLPGIRPNSRTRIQNSFMVKGVSLLQSVDPAASRGDFFSDSYLGKSVWYKRGWTFQERIFSRRALIFTEEQVYWECQTAAWCEDGLWETMESPIVYRHCFSEKEFCHPWPSEMGGFERIYRKLVQEYSQRMLTYESDGLDAFKGILNAFETDAGQRFLWALPTSLLGNALTWSGDITQRRQVKCTVSVQEEGSCAATITVCPFPSWSWVGWVGEIDFARSHGKLDADTVDLIFFYLDGSGSLRHVESTVATQSLSRAIARKKTTGLTSLERIRNRYDETIVTLERIRPERARRLSIASNILFFWSSTAILRVEQNPVLRPELSENYSLFQNGKHVNCKGNDHGNIWNQYVEPGHAELIEFVVIGRFVTYGGVMRPGRNELAVLLLSWDVDGVAYRRGLVFIKYSDWLELEREWKMINLG